ncbi:hypothetical protein UA08_06140 [Talaromyces atroroseus]|uniref:Lysine-specific metallo-endopeptidase domain-containing protein n=1 Tax=Talaromyces atroroseus TaxID=1441469 RepID=A0A225AHD0_TALAT|nr:hypothetical protein UA08_06140 [Talaromyces atroroseus]OKL58643.1 hypothetical protein UA08_06140 [Talaromyces atroroseus]
MRTFESIFGQVYYGFSNLAANEAAQTWALLQALTNLNNVNIQFFCDDPWLKDTDPDGDVLTSSGHWYWDGRPVGSTDGWVDLSTTNACRNNANLAGFTYPNLNGYDVVTMCQRRMSGWVDSWNSGITLTSLRLQGAQPTSFYSLDDYRPLISVTLLHELTHCAGIFTSSYGFFKDSQCDMGGTSLTAYGWNCISKMGQDSSSEAALNNAGRLYYLSPASA